jgi:xanthine dehydrogenase small subunit
VDTTFFLNDREQTISRSPGAVLLDVLRDDFGLTGTKEGCREGDCGACMALLGTLGPDGVIYRTVNSCLLPAGDVAGRHVVTIEGLNQANLSPVQKALVDEGAIQCGFCTPGLVVALTGFFLSGAPLSEADGVASVGGNICRCTGYVPIRRAIARLCGQFSGLGPNVGAPAQALAAKLVEGGILPRYFLDIPARLRRIEASRVDARAKRRAAHPPVLVAGGTDLFATQADRLHDADLTFLSRRSDLRGVRIDAGLCRVGAATPLSEVETSPDLRRLFPGLGLHFGRIASLPVRNRATIAGNIVHASPAGDLSVMFLALDATLILARGTQKREVKLRDFFKGYKVLDLGPAEMIAEIRFSIPAAATRFHFEKVARREHLDIAGVSSAIRVRVRDERIAEAHVSAGSVAPVPLYLRRTSSFLRGKPISPKTAREAAAAAAGEISTIGDVRGSGEYRRALLPRLILAHFLSLFPDLVREEDLA